MDIPEKYTKKHSEWMDFISKNPERPWDFSPSMNISDNLVGVYVIYNPDTLEFYIGTSKNIHNRLIRHRGMLFNETHYNINLQKSFYRSYYLQVMYFICTDRNSAYDLEQELIDSNIDNPSILNISVDSRNSRKNLKFSEETINKIRSSWTTARRQKASENIRQVHTILHTSQAIEKQRERMMGNKFGTGQVITEERREFLRKLNSGKTLSEETKQRISDSKKEAFANGSVRSRAVQIMVNGIRYVSSSEAGKQLNVHSGLVWHRVNSEKDKYKDWKYCK